MYLRTHLRKHRARCDRPPLAHCSTREPGLRRHTRGGASLHSPACRGHGVGLAAGILGQRDRRCSSQGVGLSLQSPLAMPTLGFFRLLTTAAMPQAAPRPQAAPAGAACSPAAHRSPCPQPHQLLLHVLVPRRADEQRVLHQTHEAPEGVGLIPDLGQDGRHKVRHALEVADGGVVHGVVQQDSPGDPGRRAGSQREPASTRPTLAAHVVACRPGWRPQAAGMSPFASVSGQGRQLWGLSSGSGEMQWPTVAPRQARPPEQGKDECGSDFLNGGCPPVTKGGLAGTFLRAANFCNPSPGSRMSGVPASGSVWFYGPEDHLLGGSVGASSRAV